MIATIMEYVLNQYCFKQGLAKYRKQAEEATEKELAQIHNMNAIKPLDPGKLSDEKKKNATVSLIFLTEKKMEC